LSEPRATPERKDAVLQMEVVILIGLQASGKSTFAQQHFATSHDYVSKDRQSNNGRPGRRQTQLITAAL